MRMYTVAICHLSNKDYDDDYNDDDGDDDDDHSVARQCYTVVRATQQVNGK